MTDAELEIERKAAWIAGNLAARQRLVDAARAILADHCRGDFLKVHRACRYLEDRFQAAKLELMLAIVDAEWPPRWLKTRVLHKHER